MEKGLLGSMIYSETFHQPDLLLIWPDYQQAYGLGQVTSPSEPLDSSVC